jgi:putative addiction module killer protein
LKDRQAMARIAARIDRLALANPGDVKPVGSGISEMRIDYGLSRVFRTTWIGDRCDPVWRR